MPSLHTQRRDTGQTNHEVFCRGNASALLACKDHNVGCIDSRLCSPMGAIWCSGLRRLSGSNSLHGVLFRIARVVGHTLLLAGEKISCQLRWDFLVASFHVTSCSGMPTVSAQIHSMGDLRAFYWEHVPGMIWLRQHQLQNHECNQFMAASVHAWQ